MTLRSVCGWPRRLMLATAVAILSAAFAAPPAIAKEPVEVLACNGIPAVHDSAVIKTVHRVGRGLGVSSKVMLAAFEAGWVESHMNNLPCGDKDSLGVFQQRPSQGWGTAEQILNVEYATTQFLNRAVTAESRFPGYNAAQIAQEVQRSCCPERYAGAEAKAESLIALAVRANAERVSDWSGDGHADVLGVDAAGLLWYYPNNNLQLSDRERLGDGWAPFLHVAAADWSGDGFADVLGVDAAGLLWYYPHSGNVLGIRSKLGQGWAPFLHVAVADWSGDGFADVLGVDAAGLLWYYPHSGNVLGQRVQIGNGGWAPFLHVMSADWSGDGKADVLGIDAAGDLWYYPHNGDTLSARQKIGNGGWETFQFVRAMDFSGDGYADVIGVDAAGVMWYYPHNGNGLSAAQRIGAGFSPFHHIL